MKKIYFVIDEEGYIKGGYSESELVGENVRSVEVEEEHEIFNSDAEIFKYVDGELIKDEERKQQIIKEFDDQRNKPSEIELLRQENEMLALAIMELSTIVLSGGE